MSHSPSLHRENWVRKIAVHIRSQTRECIGKNGRESTSSSSAWKLHFNYVNSPSGSNGKATQLKSFYGGGDAWFITELKHKPSGSAKRQRKPITHHVLWWAIAYVHLSMSMSNPRPHHALWWAIAYVHLAWAWAIQGYRTVDAHTDILARMIESSWANGSLN